MRIFILIFLASLIIAKILLGSVFMYQLKADPLGLEGHAIASELPENSEVETKGQRTTAKKQDFDMDFLLRKQTDLQHQEEELAKKKSGTHGHSRGDQQKNRVPYPVTE